MSACTYICLILDLIPTWEQQKGHLWPSSWPLALLNTLLPTGSGFVMCSGKENPDSDADLDVDGDDTLEYGKPQYPWGEVGQANSNKSSWYL